MTNESLEYFQAQSRIFRTRPIVRMFTGMPTNEELAVTRKGELVFILAADKSTATRITLAVLTKLANYINTPAYELYKRVYIAYKSDTAYATKMFPYSMAINDLRHFMNKNLPALTDMLARDVRHCAINFFNGKTHSFSQLNPPTDGMVEFLDNRPEFNVIATGTGRFSTPAQNIAKQSTSDCELCKLEPHSRTHLIQGVDQAKPMSEESLVYLADTANQSSAGCHTIRGVVLAEPLTDEQQAYLKDKADESLNTLEKRAIQYEVDNPANWYNKPVVHVEDTAQRMYYCVTSDAKGPIEIQSFTLTPNYYRAALSFDAFRNLELKKRTVGNTGVSHAFYNERDCKMFVKGEARSGNVLGALQLCLSIENVGSVWDMYQAIGYDYKKKRYA
jgi:hypothetical protein